MCKIHLGFGPFSHGFYLWLFLRIGLFTQNISWGGILGRNPDICLKSFPPCYLQAHLQLCLKISSSSNSRTVQLLYNVKEKGWKPDRKPYPIPYGLRNPYRNLKSESSKVMPRNLKWNCMFMNLASKVRFLTPHCKLIKDSVSFLERTWLVKNALGWNYLGDSPLKSVDGNGRDMVSDDRQVRILLIIQ